MEDLTNREFEQYRDLIYTESGITLNETKKGLLKARLRKRMVAHGIDSYSGYLEYVRSDRTGTELTMLLDAISTNVTSFFREIKHFEFMNKAFLPELAAHYTGNPNATIRIWSSASSSGEEPYSILFTLLESKDFRPSWQLKMLATDISTGILSMAIQGFYEARKVATVPPPLLDKYFVKGHDNTEGYYTVKDDIRKKISFRRLNLMTPHFPFSHKFDLIFCRNVMIYFDVPTRAKLINKFYDSLRSGGYLFIGHSETLSGIDHKFKYIQPTVFKKP